MIGLFVIQDSTLLNILKLFFVLFLLSLALLILVNKKKIPLSMDGLVILCLFLLVIVHSIFFSQDMHDSLMNSIFAFCCIMAAFFVSQIKITALDKVIKLIYYSMAAFFIISSDWILLFDPEPKYFPGGAFIGYSISANSLALRIGIFLFPFFAQKLIEQFKKNSFLTNLFLILINLNFLYILFLSKSRGAIVGCIAIVVILFYRSNLQRQTKIFLSIFILIVLLVLKNYIYSYFVFKYAGVDILATRLMLWKQRLWDIQHNLYFGVGYEVNPFWDGYRDKLEKGSFYLSLIEEFGVLLSIGYAFIFARVFYKAFEIPRKYAYIGMFVIGAMIESIFENWILNFNGYFAIFFWIAVFWIFNLAKNEQNSKIKTIKQS